MSTALHTAILPAAGLGTRLLPATKSVPKELMTIYDRPLIQFAVDEARVSGIKRLVVVTHPSKSSIQDYFEHDASLRKDLHRAGKQHLADQLDALDPSRDMEIVFAYQHEAKGLGDAVACARDQVGSGPVAVILPDDLILGDRPTIGAMAQIYDPGLATHMMAAMTVTAEDVSKYGIFDAELPAPGRQVKARGLVEKPQPADAPSQLAVIGRYILGPDIFDALTDTAPGAGGEVQLTDAIATALGRGGVAAFRTEGKRFDCGSHDGLLAASVAYRARQNTASAA